LPCNLPGCIFLLLYLLLLDELNSFIGLLFLTTTTTATTTATTSSKPPCNGDSSINPLHQLNLEETKLNETKQKKKTNKTNVETWAQSVEDKFKTKITHFYLVLQRYLFDIMSIFECIIQNFKVNMSLKYIFFLNQQPQSNHMPVLMLFM